MTTGAGASPAAPSCRTVRGVVPPPPPHHTAALPQVMIWDDHQGKCIGELSFRSQVRGASLPAPPLFGAGQPSSCQCRRREQHGWCVGQSVKSRAWPHPLRHTHGRCSQPSALGPTPSPAPGAGACRSAPRGPATQHKAAPRRGCERRRRPPPCARLGTPLASALSLAVCLPSKSKSIPHPLAAWAPALAHGVRRSGRCGCGGTAWWWLWSSRCSCTTLPTSSCCTRLRRCPTCGVWWRSRLRRRARCWRARACTRGRCGHMGQGFRWLGRHMLRNRFASKRRPGHTFQRAPRQAGAKP